MRLLDRSLVCLYMAFAMLPAIAMIFGWPDRPLTGALAPAPMPALSFEAVKTEKFQHETTKWFEQSLGYRNHAIVVDNTLTYHLFGETKFLARVIVGRDGVLFERDDINFLNKAALAQDKLDSVADKVALLQTRLRARGRAFVPLLVPSKTSIYGDAVPERWQLQFDGPRPADSLSERVRKAFDRRNIIYVDAGDVLRSPSTPRHLMWGRQARHWSDLGACLVLREIGVRVAELTGAPLDIPCAYTLGRVLRSHDDYDLLRLLNVWRAHHDKQTAIVSYPAPGSAPRPSLTFIGTSFEWQLVRVAQETRRFGEIFLAYYNWILYAVTRRIEVENAEVGSPLWRDGLAAPDIYVYELFETYLLGDERLIRVLDELLANLGDG